MPFKNTLFAVAVSGLLALGACTEPVEVDYVAEIIAANDAFETHFNAGDAAGVASLYTDDAILLPPGSPAVTGNEATTALWQAVLDSGLAGVDLVTDEVTGNGDTAIERGHIIGFDGEGNQIATGKYMVYWKKVEGSWKLHHDIWNMDS